MRQSLDTHLQRCYTDFVSRMLTNTDKETDMRSKFTVTGHNTVEHTGTCPWTGETFIRRYWTPIRTDGYAGYVRVDDSKDGSMGGTLGKQPHNSGVTWMCKPENLLDMVKREWQAEKRMAAKQYL